MSRPSRDDRKLAEFRAEMRASDKQLAERFRERDRRESRDEQPAKPTKPAPGSVPDVLAGLVDPESPRRTVPDPPKPAPRRRPHPVRVATAEVPYVAGMEQDNAARFQLIVSALGTKPSLDDGAAIARIAQAATYGDIEVLARLIREERS